MRFEPLGDQALLAYCDDENQAVAVAAHVRRGNPPWLVDVVQAYVSVAVYYELATTDYFEVADWLARTFPSHAPETTRTGREHDIPCCYEFGLDFEAVQKHTGLDHDAIIAAHCQSVFTVYAIGFCPGFPYLGYLPPALTGVPRLSSPRLHVDAGSVGLTGRQTGIYTEVRPGGWNIIGKTPLTLVDVADGYFPLRTGDAIRFRAIDRSEFQALLGQRLPLAA